MKNRITGMLTIALSLLILNSTVSCRNEKENETSYEEEYEMEGEEEESEGRGPRLTGADKQASQWFWEKAYPDPRNISRKYLNAWDQMQEIEKNSLLNNVAHRPNAGMGNWTAWGPKVFGGRIVSIAINPLAAASGNNTIYLGTASGGIWRSYSHGAGATAWHPIEMKAPVLGVSSVVYHPTDTTQLLAGTGEVYRTQTLTNGANTADQVGNIGRSVWKARGTYGIGIFKSTDGGSNWSHVMVADTQALFGIQKIRYNPINPDTVFACGTDGLYRSIDAGTSWSKIWTGTHLTDVMVNPRDTRQIIVAAGNADNTAKGLWRSTDQGANFSKLTFATNAIPDAYSRFKGYTVLAMAKLDTLYASFGNGDTNGDGSFTENEVYRTLDFGTTWSVISNSNHGSFQAWFSHCLAVFPGSTTKLFAAGVNKYIFTISGTTGTSTAVGGGGATMSSYLLPGDQEGGSTYVHADVHDIQFMPGNPNIAFLATDGGLFRTANANGATGSMTFTSCNGGLQIQQFYPTVGQSRGTANLFLGGLQDNNVVRWNGTGWAKIIGGDGGPVAIKPNDDAIILASRDTRAVYRSINAGATFGGSPILAYLGTVPVGNDDRTSFMSPVAVSPADPLRWYVGSDNIHVSTLSGTTFGTFSNNDASGIPLTNYIEARNKTALAIGVSPTDAQTLYVSVSPFAQNVTTSTETVYFNPPSNIRKSTNGGGAFATRATGLPDRLYTDFAISTSNHDSVFVTLGGFGSQHVYVTGDGGANWSPRGNNLPDVPFNTIMIDSANRNILYAGCDFGVYVSGDRGANWYPFNNGFWDATYVMDIVPVPGNKIRAVTHGKGVFEADRWNGLVTLPVNIVSFTGINRGQFNDLNWKVEQESNLSHYLVERCTDGFSFQSVKRVNSRNNWNPSEYNYSDPIGTNPAPVYYYRLKAVNFDGTYSYSEIVQIRLTNNNKFEVLGNPFFNDLTIRYTVNQTGNLTLALYDMQGKLLRKDNVLARTGTGTYSIPDLSILPKGVYILNMEMDRKRTAIKVVKR